MLITQTRTSVNEKEDKFHINKIDQPTTGEEIPEANNVTLLLGGDVMLGRNVMQVSLNNKNYSYPFEKISGLSKNAGIFFVNLENPVIRDCPRVNSGFKFCTLPQMIEGLKMAGINIVNLANNHILNYGPSGLSETEVNLRKENITATGVGGLVTIRVNGLTFGFLGFDLTVKSLTEEDLQLIKNSDSKADFLIIGVHWGEEYKAQANSYQRKWAREMVNVGADIIVGHHPHWVQDFECLSSSDGKSSCGHNSEASDCVCDGIIGKPVYYSLGNLVFDQMWSEETKKGMIVKLEIGNNGIVKEERINTYIRNTGQPEILQNN